jgi:hypothetical protein
MFLTIVPALARVLPAAFGLRLLLSELDLLISVDPLPLPLPLPLRLLPSSTFAKSSPNLDIPEGLAFENLTLLLLSLLLPVGVVCALKLLPAIGARCFGSVNGVRSFDAPEPK